MTTRLWILQVCSQMHIFIAKSTNGATVLSCDSGVGHTITPLCGTTWQDICSGEFEYRAMGFAHIWFRIARLFDGVRVDNCHSTPLHVGQYLLDVARATKPYIFTVNPFHNLCLNSLIILLWCFQQIAEFFCPDIKKDIKFVNKLGIDALIREGQQPSTANEFCSAMHEYGGRSIGSLDDWTSTEIDLIATKPPAIYMDVSHDNQCTKDKVDNYNLLYFLSFVL